MKLRNKILTILAPAATIAAIAPIALTSCGPDSQSNSVTYSGETKLTITSAGTTLNFTLAKALGSGETLKVVPNDVHGDYPTVSITQNEGTKITVSLKLSSSGKSQSKFALLFECYNSSSTMTPIWSSTISGFDVTKTN